MKSARPPSLGWGRERRRPAVGSGAARGALALAVVAVVVITAALVVAKGGREEELKAAVARRRLSAPRQPVSLPLNVINVVSGISAAPSLRDAALLLRRHARPRASFLVATVRLPKSRTEGAAVTFTFRAGGNIEHKRPTRRVCPVDKRNCWLPVVFTLPGGTSEGTVKAEVRWPGAAGGGEPGGQLGPVAIRWPLSAAADSAPALELNQPPAGATVQYNPDSAAVLVKGSVRHRPQDDVRCVRVLWDGQPITRGFTLLTAERQQLPLCD